MVISELCNTYDIHFKGTIKINLYIKPIKVKFKTKTVDMYE